MYHTVTLLHYYSINFDQSASTNWDHKCTFEIKDASMVWCVI